MLQETGSNVFDPDGNLRFYCLWFLRTQTWWGSSLQDSSRRVTLESNPGSLDLLPSSFHPARLTAACLSLGYPRGSRPKFPGASVGKKQKPPPPGLSLSSSSLPLLPRVCCDLLLQEPAGADFRKPTPSRRGKTEDSPTTEAETPLIAFRNVPSATQSARVKTSRRQPA